MIIESVHFFLPSSRNTDSSLSVLVSSLHDQRVSLYGLNLFREHSLSVAKNEPSNPSDSPSLFVSRIFKFLVICAIESRAKFAQCEDSGIFKSLRFLSFNFSLLSSLFPPLFPLSSLLFAVSQTLSPCET